MPTFSRKDLYQQFEFPEVPAHDFEVGGVPAQYASGHPQNWHDANVLDFGADIKGDQGVGSSYYTAISPDSKLLAISTGAERILVYDVDSKELRQTLEGAGSLEFRPHVTLEREEGAEGSSKRSDGKQDQPAYTLISSVSDEAYRRGRNNQLIQWDLDQHGRLLDEEEPIDAAAFATKAIEAIMPELVTNHEWTEEFIRASTLQADFEKTLRQVAADYRRRHYTIFENARTGGFASSSFNHDGRLFLYHICNETTQHGMREPEKLPQLVIHDMDAGKEVCRLSGHTDAIMWSAFSPDSHHVASVSWDGTLRMYTVSTGELDWATENSGGQSWAGAFSPDSKFIVWSSKTGRVVQVHDVLDGRIIATFQGSFNHWCRCLVWHPSGNEIALCADKSAYVWKPFDGLNGTILQHFEIGDGGTPAIGRSMVEVHAVSWLDEGRLLCLEISEGTKLVYDTHNNVKEVFRRPKGVDGVYVRGSFYGPLQTQDQPEFYLSVDGDGKARYWRRSVASYPSWWEKDPVPAEVEKKPFPETGKYVKITKQSEKVVQPGEKSEDTWADKGAELWTAQ
jgi:WD40 repeat protein